jgi:heme/copper-type cytochrome/quinol oxidase subunit 4
MSTVSPSPSGSTPVASSSASAASGTWLLVAFALAVLVGIVPIALIGAGWWMLPVAMGTLIVLAVGVIALLARILDDEER